MQIIEFDTVNHTFTDKHLDDIDLKQLESNQDPDKFYWINTDKIKKTLHFPKEINDILHSKNLIPQFIEDAGAVYILIKSPIITENHVDYTNINYSFDLINLATNYCFSYIPDDKHITAKVYHSLDNIKIFAKTPCAIFFIILDEIIDNYTQVILNFRHSFGDIDEKLKINPKKFNNDILFIKKQFILLRQNITIIRQILIKLTSKNYKVISENCKISLTNLVTNTQLLVSESDSIQESIKDILSQIENTFTIDTNRTMKVLTAFSAIFLPMNFVTSIYGMNFHWMPELTWKYGYPATLVGLVALGTGLFTLFKVKRWL